MRRHRPLPFGAEPGPAGTRFRVWAPGARTVELWLEATDRPWPMARDPQGWASVVSAEAPPGTRYRYRIDGERLVPDPASRFQPEGVHGPSQVIDPRDYAWADAGWSGLPPEQLVFYELHVGTFTRTGTFAAVGRRLDHLVDLGVTAVELMPVADFAGNRGWGYDGVLWFAPKASYGSPDDLKALVDACHARGLAVFLDVVYNHFGPEGNYLGGYAPGFFNPRHRTPWGDAINFDGPGAEAVRAFVTENALYWLEEFHLDGLRLDAVHAIADDSRPDILEALARAVHEGPERSRRVHLVLENDRNQCRYLRPTASQGTRGAGPGYQAQWNDDVHHALHVLVTGERSGYYQDYDPPLPALGRCLTEGFAYQGDWSRHRGRPRGEPTFGLPATAFVGFLQNHDQIGNRALGERLGALASPAAIRAATAALLLSPGLPLLFMGQEWGAPEPFLFFSDLGPELGPAVREGRRREFARFPAFADPAARERIPDPQAPETRDQSVLDWSLARFVPHRDWLVFHRAVLRVRRETVVPLLARDPHPLARWRPLAESALEVTWVFQDGPVLGLVANLGPAPVAGIGPGTPWEPSVYSTGMGGTGEEVLPPFSMALFVRPGADSRTLDPGG